MALDRAEQREISGDSLRPSRRPPAHQLPSEQHSEAEQPVQEQHQHNPSSYPPIIARRERLRSLSAVSVPQSVTAATSDQRELQARVLMRYLPAYCVAQKTPPDPTTFAPPDWSFLTPGIARSFLRAVDEGGIEDAESFLFEKPGGQVRVYREGFLEIAAAGVLVLDYKWPVEHLRFQSPQRGQATPGALDLLAWTDHECWAVAVAGEVKWRQQDAGRLLRALRACGELGEHVEGACEAKKSDHRKYVGLVEFRPDVLWIIGPDAFTKDGPDLVFAPEVSDGGKVRLVETHPDKLSVRRNRPGHAARG